MDKEYFSLGELIYSLTAVMKGINNWPNDIELDHINVLKDFLEDLRKFYGQPIRVTSGFRCKELNTFVGGVSNSAHISGWAADIQPGDGKFEEFCLIVLDFLKDKDFDQCIIEKNSKGAKWVHLSIDPRNRKKSFKMNVK